LAAWRWLATDRDVLPFLASVALFLLGYLGLLISNFPYVVPSSLTIWQTAAAPATHVFFLLGPLVMLPIILGYMIFVYDLQRKAARGRRIDPAAPVASIIEIGQSCCFFLLFTGKRQLPCRDFFATATCRAPFGFDLLRPRKRSAGRRP